MTHGRSRQADRSYDAYWQSDHELGEARLGREQTTIRMCAHRSEEKYWARNEIVPLTQRNGERIYVHARPYVLEPDIRLVVALYGKPSPEGAIGEVVASHWNGMRHRDIGNAQAWSYPAERLAVLWECYLYEPFGNGHPSEDPALKAVWDGFERYVFQELPPFERIVTPAWEPLYPNEEWQEFLRQQGYRELNKMAFVKELPNR